MGDTFIEQIVKRKNRGAVLAKQIGVGVLALILLAIAIFFCFTPLVSVAFVVAAAIVYGAWWLITSMNVEFEYIYTNGEMDVDRIAAKRKRKRVTTVRVSSFEEFAPFDREQYRQKRYDITIDAAVSMADPNAWYASYTNREGKKCCLVFSPEEEFRKELEAQFKRSRTFGRQ